MNQKNTTVTAVASCAIIGIGNDLAGDDGAGIATITRLNNMLREPLRSRILLTTLCGDLFSVTDYLHSVKRIIFIDAIIGETPGVLVTIHPDQPQTVSPSFHQMDIITTMRILKKTEKQCGFPPWEIRGITILPPDRLVQRLSPAVAAAVKRLTRQLTDELQQEYTPISHHTVSENPHHE